MNPNCLIPDETNKEEKVFAWNIHKEPTTEVIAVNMDPNSVNATINNGTTFRTILNTIINKGDKLLKPKRIQ